MPSSLPDASSAATSLSHHLSQPVTTSASSSSSTPRPSRPQSPMTVQTTTTTASPSSSLLSSSGPSQSRQIRPQSSSSSLTVRPAAVPAVATSSIVAASITSAGGPTAASSTASTKLAKADREEEKIWKSAAARKAERNWKRQSEKSLSSDGRYRKYGALIDRALASFDSIAEWADFVGALGRLEKIFAAPPPLPTSIIPRSLLLSKRLSQCLNPALPSGVHHRALSVYRQIFLLLSVDGLRRDLAIWTPGLFSFFERANTSTRPIVLSLLEDFYLPLGEDLKPTTRAFILAVLPGLEEEGAENFDRTLKLIDSLHRCVGKELFWKCLWAAIIGNPNIRQAAINALNKRPPPQDTPRPPIPPYLGLQSRAIAALLTSSDVLIVRGGLDILLQNLSLSSALYQALPRADQVDVMKSAIALVLRRELSLNRRLWSWLGGSKETGGGTSSAAGDEEEGEVEHLKKYGLDILKEALLQDMIRYPPFATRNTEPVAQEDEEVEPADHSLASRQRPFRIFLSLLDKWSVGSPLTSVLALDALRALEYQVRGSLDTSSKTAAPARELMTSGGMLFDALGKQLITKQLLVELGKELQPAEDENRIKEKQLTLPASELLSFVLKHLTFRDDVSCSVHLPNLLAATLVMACENSQTASVQAALRACHDVLAVISPQLFEVSSAPTSERIEPSQLLQGIRTFYETPGDRIPIDFQQPAVQDVLLQLSISLSTSALQITASRGQSNQVFVSALNLCSTLLGRAAEQAHSLERIDDAQAWLSLLIGRLTSTNNFSEAEAILEVILSLNNRVRLVPTPVETFDLPALKIFEKLLDFLQPLMTIHHSRAVSLFWRLEPRTTTPRLLQTALCAGLLASPELESVKFRRALEGFGAIWQLSGDDVLVSESIAAPLARILDMLRSTDGSRRQAGETWLRCNVRSYSPIFELLFRTLDRAERSITSRIPCKLECAEGVIVESSSYVTDFDHELLNYALSSLLAVARYGAAGFVRGARAARLQTSGSSALQPSYLDDMYETLMRLLRTDDFQGSQDALFDKRNGSTHALSIDLLQLLTARGGLSMAQVGEVETCILERLLISVKRGTWDRQHRLLLALHTVVVTKAGQRNSSSMSTRSDASTPSAHPLLLKAINAALSSLANRPSLPHWVDFVLMTVPLYRKSLKGFLIPVAEQLSKVLQAARSEWTQVSGQESFVTWTEADMILLINALERVILLCLDERHSASVGQSDESEDVNAAAASIALPPPAALQSKPISNKPEQSPRPDADGGGHGLLGYVSGIFTGGSTEDEAHAARGPAQATSSTLQALHLSVQTLHSMWVVSSSTDLPALHLRCQRGFEKIYKSQPSIVAESLVDCWRREPSQDVEATFELFDILAPSPPTIVTFLCDVLSNRMPSPGSSRPHWSPDQLVTESTLFAFLEVYLSRMPTAASASAWQAVITLVKDLLANSAAHKAYLYPALRCLIVLGDKLIQTPALEDKRVKRDLQENYLKLFDLCVLVAGRSGQAPLKRDDNGHGEKTDHHQPSSDGDITNHLATVALPALRRFVTDVDKVSTSCSNAVYYIVTPPMRTKSTSYETVDPSVLLLASEISKLPVSLSKALRSPVSEAFQDLRFFRMSAKSGRRWCTPVVSLFTHEKERFLDLIGRISASAPTNINIFSNRQSEQIQRSLNLRRLSFVLYSAGRDTFLPQLPAIQEKLVDVLRVGGGAGNELMNAEAYLCLRVMLCRFNAQHLTTLWPIIITEVTRLMDSVMEELPADDSDGLQLLLSACKFLDLLLILQTEEFQVHQWLFVNDTGLLAEEAMEDSILDRLATAIEEHCPGAAHKRLSAASTPSNIATTGGTRGSPDRGRSPFLVGKREIVSVADLLPFLTTMNITSFQAAVEDSHSGRADRASIERDLGADMFGDGR